MTGLYLCPGQYPLVLIMFCPSFGSLTQVIHDWLGHWSGISHLTLSYWSASRREVTRESLVWDHSRVLSHLMVHF